MPKFIITYYRDGKDVAEELVTADSKLDAAMSANEKLQNHPNEYPAVLGISATLVREAS